ncbi:hypothetical protein BTH42_29255 [Burkholderia sp. SRS-W-2-2016]|nr:hypothetical protein BTH42_29255 [Burkholderia sp. SRS-W-2-2016]
MLAEKQSTFKFAFSWALAAQRRFRQIAGKTATLMWATTPTRLADETLWTVDPLRHPSFTEDISFLPNQGNSWEKIAGPTAAGFYAIREVFA